MNFKKFLVLLFLSIFTVACLISCNHSSGQQDGIIAFNKNENIQMELYSIIRDEYNNLQGGIFCIQNHTESTITFDAFYDVNEQKDSLWSPLSMCEGYGISQNTYSLKPHETQYIELLWEQAYNPMIEKETQKEFRLKKNFVINDKDYTITVNLSQYANAEEGIFQANAPAISDEEVIWEKDYLFTLGLD